MEEILSAGTSLLSYWPTDPLCRIPPHAELPNSCPTFDSRMGSCEVLEKMGEVVYRLHLPSTGRWVVLHRDRLAPYSIDAHPL